MVQAIRSSLVLLTGEDPTTRWAADARQWLSLHHPDRYFTPTALAGQAWNEPALSAEQVRSYVVRLRRLLERAGANCRIESRRGHGYRMALLSPDGHQTPGLAAS